MSCLSFPPFEDGFLKGFVSLSIDRQTDENTCRVELPSPEQSRVKNRTEHQISHVFLWFLSTGYWLIFHKPKSPWSPSLHATSLLERKKTGGQGEWDREGRGAA